MGTTIPSTVPVTCPGCQHEGPAFVTLLGKSSRCKKCGYVFCLPKHVRIGCPACETLLRVPVEMLGHEVCCRFCQASFHATLGQADGRRRNRRLGRRPPTTEEALARLVAEHEAIRAELDRLRMEREDSRQDRRELEDLRARLDRLQAVRPPTLVSPPMPTPSISTMPKRSSSIPSAARIGSLHRGAKPAGAPSVSIRELIERLAGCEAMTDRLIGRLRAEQERRHEDRRSFASTLDRLQGELARAREGFDPASARDSARDEIDAGASAEESSHDGLEAIAMPAPARLSDCGVAG